MLGYKDQQQAIKTNCEHPIRLCDILQTVPDTVCNEIKGLAKDWHPQALLIQRPDVHRLIVAAKRTKEEAAQFEKWIFEEVLEEVMETGTYSLPNASNSQNIDNIQNQQLINFITTQNNNLNRQNEKLMVLMETMSDQNSKMIDVISNFNSVLELAKFQKAISTAFALNEYIKFDDYVDIIRDMADINIRSNFTSVNVRVYLHKDVKETERVFKSNGEPYEKYIDSGFYRVEKDKDTKVFITKAGSEHLYWFLKAKKILN